MDKQSVYKTELEKWRGLFVDTPDATKRGADGLIEKAAYLHSLCHELEGVIALSGAIKIHPQHPELQKQVPAVKEYARLAESYANLANKLNSILAKNVLDEDEDDLEEFE